MTIADKYNIGKLHVNN